MLEYTAFYCRQPGQFYNQEPQKSRCLRPGRPPPEMASRLLDEREARACRQQQPASQAFERDSKARSGNLTSAHSYDYVQQQNDELDDH